tara:strand:- start:141 stop:386 length:246 start_codon:yes stop_codon:yes gene_type:complete
VNKLIGILLIVLGSCGLIFIAWWFHVRKHSLLDTRLANNDETLLTEPGLNIETAFQAPSGSVIHPYIIINEETTTTQHNEI